MYCPVEVQRVLAIEQGFLLVGLDMAIVNYPGKEAGPGSRKGAQETSLRLE